jgi:hypothetical protein
MADSIPKDSSDLDGPLGPVMAESKNEITPRFSGYPRAVKLPNLRLRNTEDANPVFRGQLLVIGAWL